jgi:hypothetical protein
MSRRTLMDPAIAPGSRALTAAAQVAPQGIVHCRKILSVARDDAAGGCGEVSPLGQLSFTLLAWSWQTLAGALLA